MTRPFGPPGSSYRPGPHPNYVRNPEKYTPSGTLRSLPSPVRCERAGRASASGGIGRSSLSRGGSGCLVMITVAGLGASMLAFLIA